jgi:hypothetical protein
MRKYGVEHFHIEQLEKTSEPEEREIYWINFYDSRNTGYNATNGGDGKPYIDYDLVVETYKELGFVRTTANKLHIDEKTVRKILRERDIVIVKHVNGTKKVKQYDLNGVHIKTYNSTSDAARAIVEMGKTDKSYQSARSVIGGCCNKKMNSAYGFVWQFA